VGEFQRRLPTVAEWDGWRTRWPDANVALVCGTVSRLVVLDVDPRNGGVQSLRGYPVLKPTVVTGGGGWHLHMACEEPLATHNDLLPGVDFKAEGSYVVAPPSIHPSGRPYRWVGSVLPEVPAWLQELVAATPAEMVATAIAGF
jgi:hypothetical protein